MAVIAVPAHLHLPMAARLADAGIHLLIEKPLGTSLAGVDSLVQGLTDRNLTVAVAYVLRHHPALRAMRDAIESGEFGRPVELVAVAGQHFPTYRPAYRDIYYRDHSRGGGAVQDALTHVVNAAEWLIGPVDRLIADTAHQVLEGVEVEDTVHVMARHDEVPASYSLNQHQAPNENTITVICERATCRFQLHRNSWSWISAPELPWEEKEFPSLQRDDLFVQQAHAFLDAVDGRAGPVCPLPDAIQTLRVNLAVLASAEEGVWKQVDRDQ